MLSPDGWDFARMVAVRTLLVMPAVRYAGNVTGSRMLATSALAGVCLTVAESLVAVRRAPTCFGGRDFPTIPAGQVAPPMYTPTNQTDYIEAQGYEV